MRRLIVLVPALVFGLVGPRVTSPASRAAGEPFAYEPPDGFVETKERAGEGDARVWIEKGKPGAVTTPRVVVHHSSKEMRVEEPELAKLAEEMPRAFEDSGCDWVHRRHEMRTRPDKARVGLIEGDCAHEVALEAFGLPATKVRLRKLQLIFPDDTGTSIATVSYPSEDAARWEPAFEATIASARGVATRVPPPPPWVYGGWAAAGAVLGWLGSSLVSRRSGAPPKEPTPTTKAKPAARDEDDEDEDDEDDEDEGRT